MEEWTEILDKGGAIDTIYMDFVKAFDKVPHKRLINKIRELWIVQPNYKMGRQFFEREEPKGFNRN